LLNFGRKLIIKNIFRKIWMFIFICLKNLPKKKFNNSVGNFIQLLKFLVIGINIVFSTFTDACVVCFPKSRCTSQWFKWSSILFYSPT
jgi:hypothetical protein